MSKPGRRPSEGWTKKYEEGWARMCKDGCKGPYRNDKCIYCSKEKK